MSLPSTVSSGREPALPDLGDVGMDVDHDDLRDEPANEMPAAHDPA